MKKFIEKDKRRRKLSFSHEKDRIALLAISSNRSLPSAISWKARLIVSNFSSDSFNSKLNNRCVSTGRGRSVSRSFKLSRIAFREASSSGLIPGLRKANW